VAQTARHGRQQDERRASVGVTHSHEHDSQHFRLLLATTVKRFKVKQALADKAYSSARILEQIEQAGAFSLIPFKKRRRHGRTRGAGRTCGALDVPLLQLSPGGVPRALPPAVERRDGLLMMKAKFGTSIRSKVPVAQVNEILCKVPCHNLGCLVQPIYELGIEPGLCKAS
jgi:hypothetical protein